MCEEDVCRHAAPGLSDRCTNLVRLASHSHCADVQHGRIARTSVRGGDRITQESGCMHFHTHATDAVTWTFEIAPPRVL